MIGVSHHAPHFSREVVVAGFGSLQFRKSIFQDIEFGKIFRFILGNVSFQQGELWKIGDGFSDLSKYDSDGNGWIDEADEVFDKLVIAFIKEDGSQELVKLKDRDVGAIYTGSASTDFSLNDLSTNETRARIRQTGIFLYESGMMGTIQHLDLAR